MIINDKEYIRKLFTGNIIDTLNKLNKNYFIKSSLNKYITINKLSNNVYKSIGYNHVLSNIEKYISGNVILLGKNVFSNINVTNDNNRYSILINDSGIINNIIIKFSDNSIVNKCNIYLNDNGDIYLINSMDVNGKDNIEFYNNFSVSDGNELIFEFIPNGGKDLGDLDIVIVVYNGLFFRDMNKDFYDSINESRDFIMNNNIIEIKDDDVIDMLCSNESDIDSCKNSFDNNSQIFHINKLGYYIDNDMISSAKHNNKTIVLYTSMFESDKLLIDIYLPYDLIKDNGNRVYYVIQLADCDIENKKINKMQTVFLLSINSGSQNDIITKYTYYNDNSSYKLIDKILYVKKYDGEYVESETFDSSVYNNEDQSVISFDKSKLKIDLYGISLKMNIKYNYNLLLVYIIDPDDLTMLSMGCINE